MRGCIEDICSGACERYAFGFRYLLFLSLIISCFPSRSCVLACLLACFFSFSLPLSRSPPSLLPCPSSPLLQPPPSILLVLQLSFCVSMFPSFFQFFFVDFLVCYFFRFLLACLLVFFVFLFVSLPLPSPPPLRPPLPAPPPACSNLFSPLPPLLQKAKTTNLQIISDPFHISGQDLDSIAAQPCHPRFAGHALEHEVSDLLQAAIL